MLLQHRSEADRRTYPALHCSHLVSSLAPLLLTARECTQICQALQEVCWEQLTDEAVCATLYTNDPWDHWIAKCRTRRILTWAGEHRAFLNRTTSTLPFYGRVLPSTLIDDVERTDLVAGSKTNPERVFHALGLRQIIAQSDVQGQNVRYPISPFGDAEYLVQVKDRQTLQLEGGRMHHCVASYDLHCLNGQCFISHIGPAAPEGSTLEMDPDGTVGQHRAARNHPPSVEDRNRRAAWLRSLGFKQETGTTMERVSERLHQAGIVKVSFHIYWYNDKDSVADVCAEDHNGQEVMLRTVSDDDVWDVAQETPGDTRGQ